MNPKALLESYGIEPRKSLGQNFMHDPNLIEKIVATAELMPDDTVVEVGPGTGVLTQALAKVARHVIAVELDERLNGLLESELEQYPNTYLVFADILKTNIPMLVGPKPYVVVANVPYYITSAILRHILQNPQRPKRIVMTMQYELAERITAQPDEMTVLSVSVQFYGAAQIVTRLKPAVFWPRPEIDSAVLRIDTYDQPAVDVSDEGLFFRVVRAGFSQKRKKLRNSLAGGLGIKTKVAEAILLQAQIDPQRRAQTLTLDEWGAITESVSAMITN